MKHSNTELEARVRNARARMDALKLNGHIPRTSVLVNLGRTLADLARLASGAITLVITQLRAKTRR